MEEEPLTGGWAGETGGWAGEVLAVAMERALGDLDDGWRIATEDSPIP